MAWRFKVSKYKNAAPITPKREDWISDLKVGSPTSCGNHIKASAAFVAFSVENRGGGSLGVLPLSYKGRLESSAPLLHGHSDLITDFDFSPFDDSMLATCSTDAYVRVWHIPESGLKESITEAEYSLPQFDKRIETVGFHPTVDYLLTVAYFDTVKLWDIRSEKQVYCFDEHEDQVQSCSWRANGSVFASTAKDCFIRVIDPRTKTVTHSAENHKTPKDSRVIWLGDTNQILSTGFDARRTRELRIRDLRSFNKPLKIQTFDSSTGTLMPLFDADTNMLLLAGKADVSIMYWEVTDKEPFLTEGLKYSGSHQTKGACLVPKRGLNVMNGEVNRLLQLTSNAIIPLSYQVPRKSYREFHADIFPDTPGFNPSATVSQWLSGADHPRKKISLDPAKHQGRNTVIFRAPLSERNEEKEFESPTEVEEGQIDKESSLPVPAPRTSFSVGGVAKNSPGKLPQFGIAKPFVAVKPNFGPVRLSAAPKPAQRSAFSAQENERNSEMNGERSGKFDFKCKGADSIDNKSREDANELLQKFQMMRKVESDVTTNGEEKMDGAVENYFKDMSPPLAQTNGTVCEDDESKKSSEKDEKHSRNENEKKKNIQNGSTEFSNNHFIKPSDPQIFKKEVAPSSPTPKRSQGPTRSFRRVCKFRHLKGTPAHKSMLIDNLRDINRTIPGECNGIAANGKFVALPLSGPGGKVSIIRHQVGGRLQDGVIPSFVNGASVLDFAFDPFDEHRLATGCDDGSIKFWSVPADGLRTPTNEPEHTLTNSTEKVSIVRWHPLASEVMATVAGDLLIRIWDIKGTGEPIVLEGHQDQILSMAWSPYGQFLCTVCRDGKIRVYDPRKSVNPMQEGSGPQGLRGARVLWALDGKFLVVSGFSKVSERQISVFKSTDISKPLNMVTIDVNPSILIPCYDSDSSTLFITGKGDSTIYAYEIGADSPHLFPLSHHKCSSVHQAFTILPKALCDVRQVEFCRAVRLTHSVLEPLSFTVPRIKTEFFQDDLFPPTQVTSKPTMTSEEWFGGLNKEPTFVSLKPSDMQSLSESRNGNSPPSSVPSTPPTPVMASLRQQPPSFLSNVSTEVKDTQQKLEQSMNKQMNRVATSKEQDHMEGVDEVEWDE